MTDQPLSLAVKPIITYPREAQVGKTYLMTIDLQPEEGFEWQYDEEEYPIYCTVNSELFSSEPVGEPVVVLHRYGGSYGEIRFLLRAAVAEEQEEQEGNIKVILVSRWGVPVKTINLTGLRVVGMTFVEEVAQNLLAQTIEESLESVSPPKIARAEPIESLREVSKPVEQNLKQLNLPGSDFSYSNLQNRNLNGANLRSANFKGANLGNAILTSANLSLANLSRANLVGADLSHANLYMADLSNTDLTGANLSHANLNGSTLRGAQIRRANLSHAILANAKLDGANLRGSNLQYADLQGGSLSRANLMFANLNSTILINANLTSADLRGVDLREAKLSRAILNGAKLAVANLNHADLTGTSLLRTNLGDAQLQDCNLIEARLNRAYMSGGNLRNANLYMADLGGANLLNADFSNANLQDANLVRAHLSNANLNGANLSNADLNATNLARVSLENTIVEGAVFEGNLGLSEQQKNLLYERGASVMPPPISNSSLFSTNNELENPPLFAEAKGDLEYRFLDLQEALQVYLEAVNILKQERDDIQLLEAEYERFAQEVKDYQQSLTEELENITYGEMDEWLSQEFSEELDNMHQQICQMTKLTYTLHVLWINLPRETSYSNSGNEML